MTSTKLVFKKIDANRPDSIGILSIARPDAANAFSAAVMQELTDHLAKLKTTAHLRAVVLRGKGKHFSAGADLNWMKASAALSKPENEADARKLTLLFESLYQLPVPTIAAVTGAAYGGAVGLTAACDYAVATTSAKFCLSEVKLGLLPAVILPYLARKISSGQLRRLSLSARVFNANEALNVGLVQRVCADTELEQVLKDEISQILSCSPEAQKELKILQHKLMLKSFAQNEDTVEAIAKIRTSDSAQAGLKAFFEETATPWNIQLPTEWNFDD